MSFENGYATLIAVNDNAVEKWALPDTKKDVDAISQVLNHPERCGFSGDNISVLSDKDSTGEGILNELDQLRERIEEDQSNNATAIVYYSGHGWRNLKVNPSEYYLIPYDVRENEIEASAIKATDFAAKVDALRPRRLLVIFDCCHSGGMGIKDLSGGLRGFKPFAMPTSLLMKEKALSASRDKKGLNKLKEGEGRAVLSSSKGYQYSYMRKDGKMSIFTYHLIEALTGHAQPQEGAKQVLVSDVMSHVWRRVPKSAQDDWGEEQDPDYQVSGNFPIALLLGGKGWQKGQKAPDPFDKTVFKTTIHGSVKNYLQINEMKGDIHL